MSHDPNPRTGFMGRMLAGLKRLLAGSPGGGDMPDIHVSTTENPGNLSAFRGPGGGTLTGFGTGDAEADSASKVDSSPTARAGQAKTGPDRRSSSSTD